MPKIAYVNHVFSVRSLKVIEQANDIITTYQAQGYTLTLRQLYYQFVARDLMPNTVQNYKRLGSTINHARLAGLVDWHAIEDRTRGLAGLAHWSSPESIVDSCATQFRVDRWLTQPHRVEVWIEKEALAGVFAGVCNRLDVPYLSCRGYTSQSEMWSGAMRLRNYVDRGQSVKILHFGDHDPSGIDMTRDIIDRLEIFGVKLDLERVALNMDQVRKYKAPPNPAKETDSRFAGYIKRYGDQSWELDALEPQVLAALVEREVMSLVEVDAWDAAKRQQDLGRKQLGLIATRWDDVIDMLGDDGIDNA